MSYTVPITTPANAKSTDYPQDRLLSVSAAPNFTCYGQSDLFAVSPPAGLASVLLSTPVTLSPKFLGIHCSATEARKLAVSTARSHDQTPKWSDQNPSNGVFADAGLLVWLVAAKARGADTVFTIFGTPTWASARPGEGADAYGIAGGKAEPASMASLSAYITWLMTNYGSMIDYVEVWNEPKYTYNGLGSSYFSGTPAKLAEMARTINLAAKAIKPTVKIMGVGATGVTFTDGVSPAGSNNSGVNITDFFLTASDNNAGTGKLWIDILSVHTYDHSGVNLLSNLVGVKALLDVIKAASGIAAMPVWSTEYGYITPAFSTYTGPSLSRIAAMIRYAMYHPVMGMDRCIQYSYGGTMGWQFDPVCDAEWNRWAALLNGATVSQINSINSNGQLACVINGQNVLI